MAFVIYIFGYEMNVSFSANRQNNGPWISSQLDIFFFFFGWRLSGSTFHVFLAPVLDVVVVSTVQNDHIGQNKRDTPDFYSVLSDSAVFDQLCVLLKVSILYLLIPKLCVCDSLVISS